MKRSSKIILAMATALLLASVVYATSNMRPTIQYVGEGAPSGNTYHDGDTYIDTTTLNVWIFNGTSASWTTFARFSQPSANGTNGADGASWWLVTQDPTTLPDFGNDYDFCLDSSTWNLWHKLGGQWLLIGNIKGADGIDGVNGTDGVDGKDGVNGVNGINGADGVNGTDGADGMDGISGTDGKDGTVWYNDLAYTFSEEIGKDGDYFMFANGTVEYKINGTWVYFTSLMGPKGDTGATGTTGATGATGVTGATGPQGEQGIQGIQGIQGVPGKDGINGTDGIDGTNGIDGRDGIDGKDGINGTTGIDGRDGINGTNGVNGTNGTNGIAGTFGANGTNGQDGVIPWWLYVVAAVALGASAYAVYKSRQKPKAEDLKPGARGEDIPLQAPSRPAS